MSQDNVEIVPVAYSLAKESETYSFVAANHDAAPKAVRGALCG
jgi:hypothetical protein